MKNYDFYVKLISTSDKLMILYNRQKSVPYYTAISTGFAIKELSLYDTLTIHNLYRFERIKISALAEAMHFKRSHMTNILKRLEVFGIIERFQNENDGRSYFVQLISEAKMRYDIYSFEFLAFYQDKLGNALGKYEISMINSFFDEINCLFEKVRACNKIKMLSFKTINTGKEYFDRFWNSFTLLADNNNRMMTFVPSKKSPLYIKAGFSFYHNDALLYLIYANSAVTVSYFEQKMFIKRYQATRIVDKLVKTGFARRFKKDGDRKSVFVELTELGKTVMQFNEAANIDYIMKTFHNALCDSELDRMLEIYQFLGNKLDTHKIF